MKTNFAKRNLCLFMKIVCTHRSKKQCDHVVGDVGKCSGHKVLNLNFECKL